MQSIEIGDYISDLANNMLIQKQNQLEDFIKRRLKETTGITIKNINDIKEVKKQYCILLLHVKEDYYSYQHILYDNNTYIKHSALYTLEFDIPEPNKEGIHYMNRMGNIYKFIKDNEGMWVIR